MVSPDVVVFQWINGLAGHWRPADILLGTLATDYLIPVAMALLLLGLWFGGHDKASKHRYQRAVMVACVGLALTSLAVQFASHLSPWPRPFLADHQVTLNPYFYPPHDPSFPANTAAIGMTVAVALLSGGLRRLSLAVLGLALVYSFARVYSGGHYPLDVLGGWAIGGAIASGVSYILMPLAAPLASIFTRVLRYLRLA